MTTISFLRAAYFDASTSAAPGTWLRAIISDSSRYTVETNTNSKLVLVSNGAGFTAGWKVEFLPQVAFQPALVGHVAGQVATVNLYDPPAPWCLRSPTFPPTPPSACSPARRGSTSSAPSSSAPTPMTS